MFAFLAGYKREHFKFMVMTYGLFKTVPSPESFPWMSNIIYVDLHCCHCEFTLFILEFVSFQGSTV